MIKVLISADSKYPLDRKRIRTLVSDFLKEQGVTTEMSVGVSVVGDRKMKTLNKKYLKRDETTDVLSFSQFEGREGFVEPPDAEAHLGDVVVSYPQAVRQALERNILVDSELDFLIQHGLLHLLGIHHD